MAQSARSAKLQNNAEESNTLYDQELKPFSSTRMILALMGSLPCTWREPHDASVHPYHSTILYCLVLYSFISYSVYELSKIMLYRLYSEGSQLSSLQRVLAIDSIALMLPHSIVVVMWVEGKALWSGVKAWALLKMQYKRVTGTTLANKRKWLERILNLLIVFLPPAFIISIFSVIKDSEIGSAAMPAYIYGNMVQFGLLLLWIGYFTAIGDVAEDISTEFQKHLSDGEMCATMVMEYRKLWLALRMVPDIMARCSVPLFIMVNIIFLSSVIIFNGISLLWDGYVTFALAHIVASCAYLSQMFFISLMSNRTNEQMNSLFSRVLSPVSLGDFDTATQREIIKFFLVERARPAASSFCGYVVVDKHMFISMLTAITEYIIVIAQFRAASRRKNPSVSQ